MPRENNRVPEAKYRLTDINVVEVSLVTEPAVPSAKFAVVKAGDGRFDMRFDKVASIVKIDEEKQIIYATALLEGEPDWQSDLITDPNDVEKAAHSLLINMGSGRQKGTGAGYMHTEFDDGQYIVESMFDNDGSICKSKGFPAEKCKPNSWIVGIYIASKAKWAEVKEGKITGVSIGALAKRTALAETEKSDGIVFNLLKSYLKKKGYFAVKAIDFDSSYAMQIFYDQCPDMWDSLLSAFWSIMYDDNLTVGQKTDAIEESLRQFAGRIRSLLGTEKGVSKTIEIIEVTNGGEEPSEQGEIEMQISEVDLNKMIADKVSASVTEAVKKALETNKSADGDAPTGIQKSINEINAKLDKIAKGEEGEFASLTVKAVEKLQASITALGKTVTGSQTIPEDESEKAKKAESVFKGTVFNFLRTD